MKTLAETHRAEIEKFTDLDMNALTKLTHLYEFDRAVQCAAWGYPTEGAYYRDASSVDSALAIRIPYLAINSTDDPVSPLDSPYSGDQDSYTDHCTVRSLRRRLCRTAKSSRTLIQCSAPPRSAATWAGSRSVVVGGTAVPFVPLFC